MLECIAYRLALILAYSIVFYTSLSFVRAQNIQIRVTDEKDKEVLSAALAQNQRTGQYGLADEQGLIHIHGLSGDSVEVHCLGYKDTTIIIEKKVSSYKASLNPMVLAPLIVSESLHKKAAQGLQSTPMKFLTSVPGLTGESDILKSLWFLPGVSGGKEGYAHLFVRGGQQDQNLILYDGATLFNINHLGGFISLFHTEIIQNVDFYKSYWPSAYGGRLSSVLNVSTRNGNKDHFEGEVDIGLLTAKTSISGPLSTNGQTSFSVGARTTFIDLIFLPRRIRIANHKTHGNIPGYTFYDLNAKIDHQINENQGLSWSLYHGSDIQLGHSYEFVNKAPNESIKKYGLRNWTSSLNYYWIRNVQHSFQFHMSYSDHSNYLKGTNEYADTDFQQNIISTIHTARASNNDIYSVKARASGRYYGTGNMKFRYGLEAEHIGYQFRFDRTEQIQSQWTETEDSFTGRIKQDPSFTFATFFDSEIQLVPSLILKGGLRLSNFSSENFNQWLPEPKGMLTWNLSPRSSLNASFNHQAQPVHLIAYNLEGFFIENFLTSDQNIRPSTSDQWSLGYFRTFDEGIDNFSVETFYKKQDNILKYFLPQSDIQNILKFQDHLHSNGETKSYGLEMMVQKTSDPFHGSLSYTWSQTKSTFPTLNQGKSFPSDFDYRHLINTLFIYHMKHDLQLSFQWTYQTGRPITWSNEEVRSNPLTGTSYEALPGINNERLPAYHRMDIGLKKERLSDQNNKRRWFGINVYNAYFQKNPYALVRQRGQWKIRSVFPLIPSINFGFEL
ncbi:TonB-dependent receptor plug domain-containing protein [Membranicola marinus]|uniref:TonB-dependent receptor plug domain-containing protein n=1 Tax=Membranihabitans marinus TaxID=1227546 RepID=A0A953LCA3_9BACT|nr:TonB-dependent receptor plug domain-containing protein [Membranihabitans marinus]MBY5957539.1 TonB-dependent receptor plug domain-containing protein [Membranihabitans marinus]